MSDLDPVQLVRAAGRGFTVMVVAGLLVVLVSGLLGPVTGVALTLAAVGAFAAAAWEMPTPLSGAAAGGTTYLLFLPLAFLGSGPDPDLLLVPPLLAGAVAVGAATAWLRGRRTAGQD